MTNIELTDKDAELFLKFLKYQDLWDEIFKIRDGSVELHFDLQGELHKTGWHNYKRVIK